MEHYGRYGRYGRLACLLCLLWIDVGRNLTLLMVNSSRYHPAWASLARDYLSIMSSSVSSERAFSQGGITINK